MEKERRGGDIIFPILLISLGVVFLLNNFDYLPWSVWREIWRLWPILLILWGAQLIFGRNRYLSWLLAIIVLIVAAVIIVLALGTQSESVSGWIKDNLPYLEKLYFKK